MALVRAALLALCLWAPRPAEGYMPKTTTWFGFKPHPESMMSTTELIQQQGYPAETHEVRTADGYLLTIHRIPRSPRLTNESKPHGTPVLLGHGMASNDEQWALFNDSIAFFLADRGFDIWLGNYRGSFYGRRHARLSSDSPQFWDFSWHENGVYDQPAMTDYILRRTGRSGVIMVGHSMSSTVQAVMLAERPEYNGKVLASIFMAPPVYFRHPGGVIELYRAVSRLLPLIQDAFSSHVANYRMPLADLSSLLLCHPMVRRAKPRAPCRLMYEFLGGQPNEPQDHSNPLMGSYARFEHYLTTLEVETCPEFWPPSPVSGISTVHCEYPLQERFIRVLGHFPSYVSIRQPMHYYQGIASGGEFQKYDFGPRRNKKLYGTAIAPRYNLSNIVSPSHVYYSATDNLVPPLDAEEFAKDLPGLKGLHKVPFRHFNHGDFILGSASAVRNLQENILESLNKYI